MSIFHCAPLSWHRRCISNDRAPRRGLAAAQLAVFRASRRENPDIGVTMTILNREELHSLVGKQSDHCISIYLPTHRAEAEIRQDTIGLRSLLQEAENRLLKLGLWATKAHELLKPAQQLLDQESFWQHQSDGLALFMTEDFFRHYSLPLRFPKLAVVTDRFHLKPLLRYFTGDSQFYILALSPNRVRAFQGSRNSLSEILLEGMPVNLADAPGEEEPEKISPFHVAVPSGRIGSPAFHEQVREDEVRRYRLRRLFRWVDASLPDLLTNEHAPLVLAGAEYLHPIYRSVSTYRHILIEGIHGDPERTPLEELHKQAWASLRRYYQRARKEAEELYWELTGTGKTTNSVSEAAVAAVHGRIATLFVQVDVQSRGSSDAKWSTVAPREDAQPCDEDRLDLLALRTLASGGTVFAVSQEQMPDISPIAAIFRY
jgi:Bacterial archaeo-eukaryotic release factor family 3